MILPVVARRPWMDDAACVGAHPDAFTVNVPAPMVCEYPKIEAAKEVCAGCPVVSECLAYAYETDDQAGILGGLTPQERRKKRTGK